MLTSAIIIICYNPIFTYEYNASVCLNFYSKLIELFGVCFSLP